MSNTSFCFRHTSLLSTRSSQSHNKCTSLMSHHWVNNNCNKVKGQHWRWLIFALHDFRPTTVLESFTNSTENTCDGVFFSFRFISCLFFSIPDNWCCKFIFQWCNLHIFSHVLLLYCIYCQGSHLFGQLPLKDVH